jgi:hypothetical protein
MANDRTHAEDQMFRPTVLLCGTLCARPAFIRSAGNDQMGTRADAHTLRRERKKNGPDNWAAFRILVERVGFEPIKVSLIFIGVHDATI